MMVEEPPCTTRVRGDTSKFSLYSVGWLRYSTEVHELVTMIYQWPRFHANVNQHKSWVNLCCIYLRPPTC